MIKYKLLLFLTLFVSSTTSASSFWFDPLPANGTQSYLRFGTVSVGKHGNSDITTNVVMAGMSHNVHPLIRISYFVADDIDDPETISNKNGIRVKGEFDFASGVGIEMFAYRSMKLGLYGHIGANFNIHKYTNLNKPKRKIISLFGSSDATEDLEAPDDYYTSTTEHTSYSYGFGGKYYITKQFFFQAEYMIYNNESNVDIAGQSIGIGVRW